MATLAADGLVVTLGHDPDGRIVAVARGSAGETWQVWAPDAYAAADDLAGRVGVELDDRCNEKRAAPVVERPVIECECGRRSASASGCD